jgi:hypothetical protein
MRKYVPSDYMVDAETNWIATGDSEYVKVEDLPRWIPVSEGLPPIVHRPGQSSDDVFIALQYPDGEHLLTIGYYSHSDQIWHSRTAKHGWQPTHWRPLPEPPEVK